MRSLVIEAPEINLIGTIYILTSLSSLEDTRDVKFIHTYVSFLLSNTKERSTSYIPPFRNLRNIWR